MMILVNNVGGLLVQSFNFKPLSCYKPSEVDDTIS